MKIVIYKNRSRLNKSSNKSKSSITSRLQCVNEIKELGVVYDNRLKSPI